VSKRHHHRWLEYLTENAKTSDWRQILDPFDGIDAPQVSLHMAVLVEPYMQFLLDGQKTVESRFSVHRVPPYRCVEAGDVVLVKASGGPVVGAFTASAVWYYRLDLSSWQDVRREFAAALCAQDRFWEERSAASFATLVRVSDVGRLPPVAVPKRDRRGWVVLATRRREDLLLQ
jgi:hypothetical protein